MSEEFTNIEINLSENERTVLCTLFLEKILTPASLSVFTEVKRDTLDIKEAIYSAILNQSIIDIIEQQIERMKEEKE